jgi:hypothetical protein
MDGRSQISKDRILGGRASEILLRRGQWKLFMQALAGPAWGVCCWRTSEGGVGDLHEGERGREGEPKGVWEKTTGRASVVVVVVVVAETVVWE